MNDSTEERQLRVGLYLRVSTKEQAEKYGLEAQRASIEAIIKSKGKLKDGRDAMVLTDEKYVYVDDGISGTIALSERPAFARLMEDVANTPENQRPFDIVAVYKIDRFARKLRILLDVIEFFQKSNIEFISAVESIDTSTPFGRAMLNIMGTIAELELETIRERTTQGRERANIEGKFMGKSPKYGYIKDENGFLVILKEEAEVVERIFSLFVSNKLTPQLIADVLTKDGILSPEVSAIKYQKNKGKGQSKKTNPPEFWRAEIVRSILSDEIYIGHQYYGKFKNDKKLPKSEWKRASKDHDSIILDYIFELAQTRLVDLAKKRLLTKRKEQGRLYLLSGLLKCDHCRSLSEPRESEMMTWTGGRKLIDKIQNRYSYYYYCNRKNLAKYKVVCPVVPIPAEPIEKYVTNFVYELISNPKRVYEYQEKLKSSLLEKQSIKQMQYKKKNFEKLLSSLPERRKNLSYQHEQGVIDNPTLNLRLKELGDKEKLYGKEINEIDFRLSEIFLSKGYEASLDLYSQRYSKVLNKILNDRKELYNLIHGLVYQVVVYSRPTGKRDKIAGRKKEGQMIPNKIDIHLNLPQNLLQELYTQKFSVKSDNLWTFSNKFERISKVAAADRNQPPHYLYARPAVSLIFSARYFTFAKANA